MYVALSLFLFSDLFRLQQVVAIWLPADNDKENGRGKHLS